MFPSSSTFECLQILCLEAPNREILLSSHDFPDTLFFETRRSTPCPCYHDYRLRIDLTYCLNYCLDCSRKTHNYSVTHLHPYN